MKLEFFYNGQANLSPENYECYTNLANHKDNTKNNHNKIRMSHQIVRTIWCEQKGRVDVVGWVEMADYQTMVKQDVSWQKQYGLYKEEVEGCSTEIVTGYKASEFNYRINY